MTVIGIQQLISRYLLRYTEKLLKSSLLNGVTAKTTPHVPNGKLNLPKRGMYCLIRFLAIESLLRWQFKIHF